MRKTVSALPRSPATSSELEEADRLVRETQDRAAALVRAQLGPSPVEREQLLDQARDRAT